MERQNPVLGGVGAAVMPDEYYAKLRAGLSLFELRLATKKDMDQEIYGPFDCRVWENEDANPFEPQFEVKWLTQRDAHIRYFVDNKGNGVAWMPDDKFWHNRLFIMNVPSMNVANLHTPSGHIVSGAQINMELNCLREELMHQVPIFKVMKNGREICFKYNERDAKAEIRALETMASQLAVDKVTGQLKQRTIQRAEYTIEKGNYPDYKPEIKELIRKYGRLQFGWTECQQFMEEIKPRVMEKIDELKTSYSTGAGKVDILGALSEMTPEQKRKIAKILNVDSGTAGKNANIKGGNDDSMPDIGTLKPPKQVVR